MGYREFVAFFRYVDSLQNEPAPVSFSQDLGLMLYDVFDLGRTNDSFAEPFVSLFRARVEEGVLDVPAFDTDEVLKPAPQQRRTG